MDFSFFLLKMVSNSIEIGSLIQDDYFLTQSQKISIEECINLISKSKKNMDILEHKISVICDPKYKLDKTYYCCMFNSIFEVEIMMQRIRKKILYIENDISMLSCVNSNDSILK
jgi:hypothetical protein